MIEGRVEVRDHQDDRDAPRARLVKALKALRAAGDRIADLQKALEMAIAWIGAAADSDRPSAHYAGLIAELRGTMAASPLAWQDDPEIDWTGIER